MDSGAPVTLGLGPGIAFVFDSANSTWYRI